MYFICVFTLHSIQLTPQKLSAWRKNHPGAPGAGVWPEDQVLHRGREHGRRRYQEVLLFLFYVFMSSFVFIDVYSIHITIQSVPMTQYYC